MDRFIVCTSEEPLQHNEFLDPWETERSFNTEGINRYGIGIRGDDVQELQAASDIVRYLLSADDTEGEWVYTRGRSLAFGNPFREVHNQPRAERLLAQLEQQTTRQRLEEGWTICGPDPALPFNKYQTNRHIALKRADANTLQGFAPGNTRLKPLDRLALLLSKKAQGCSAADQVLRPDLAMIWDPEPVNLTQPLVNWLIRSETTLVYSTVDNTSVIFGIIIVGPRKIDTEDMIHKGLIDMAAPFTPDRSMWAPYKEGLDPAFRGFPRTPRSADADGDPPGK
jgi:hypothetical protein